MAGQMQVLRAKLARAKAAKKKSDGAALGLERLRAEGRREAEAARRQEEAARAFRREGKRRH